MLHCRGEEFEKARFMPAELRVYLATLFEALAIGRNICRSVSCDISSTNPSHSDQDLLFAGHVVFDHLCFLLDVEAAIYIIQSSRVTELTTQNSIYFTVFMITFPCNNLLSSELSTDASDKVGPSRDSHLNLARRGRSGTCNMKSPTDRVNSPFSDVTLHRATVISALPFIFSYAG